MFKFNYSEFNKVFISIRDLPYKIPTNKDINSIGCESKSIALFRKLSNFHVRIGIAYFEWAQSLIALNVNIPDSILQAANQFNGANIHTFLSINLDNKWFCIDPTWDLPLKKLGFPVNDVWNTAHDMKLGVFPKNIIYVDSINEYIKIKSQYWNKNHTSLKDAINFLKYANLFNNFVCDARDKKIQ